MRFVWSLPGPDQLLGQVVEALRVGRHVLLDWPVYAPPVTEFRLALADRLAALGFHLQRMSPEVGAEPRQWITDQFELDRKLTPTLPNLLEHTEWAGTMHWLEPADEVPAWLTFVQELAGHTNNQRVYERALLVMAVLPSMALPSQDAGIAVFKWDDYYDDVDALMLAHIGLRNRFQGVTRALLASTSAQVALYDVPLHLRLLSEERETLLSPAPFLREEATSRNWGARTERSRLLGSAVVFAGNERLHSCIKVLDGGIDRRLWRSQVNVLLPFLEEERQIYIRRYARYLQLPFETDFAIITELSNLELSHLTYQAEARFRNHALHDIPQMKRLTEIRHSLSHLKAVPTHTMLALLDQSP